MPTLADIAAEHESAKARSHLLTTLPIPPRITNPTANVIALRAGQWAHDNAEPDDGDDSLPVDTRDHPPTPRPLLDAAAVIAEAERNGKAIAERISDPSAASAIEAGILRGELRGAELLIAQLQAELQMCAEHAWHGDDYLRSEAYGRCVRLYGVREVAEHV